MPRGLWLRGVVGMVLELAAVRDARPVPALRTLLLGPAAQRLPERVEAAVRREQAQGEVIVTLIQALAIVLFGVLYTLTPKAFPPNVPFEPVPLALAVYALFTAARLALALRGRLREWFLALSVVADVVLLMVTIWSFHLQYGAPPAIYLKAPTLMYVFILIALRTLRFEPGYVLLCGAAAALGWLLLVAYALLDDPRVMVTHDFAAYAMSYSVLVGAEVDKVVSILVVTLILALALHRARGLLGRALREQQAAADLSRFFAPEIAGRIARAELDLEPGQAELREAAVLVVDLRGFTPLSARLSPPQVMALLADYQGRMVAAIRRHGGSVDKFLGDGILASFGAVRASATFAADAARAVEAVVEEAAAWAEGRRAAGEEPLAVGVALASGRVMFGCVGDHDRLEYTVIGEAVNLAAKLEKHGKAEAASALLPAETLALAEAQGFRPSLPWQRRAGRTVAGMPEPVDLAVLPRGEG
jgi:adenylate cyclase